MDLLQLFTKNIRVDMLGYIGGAIAAAIYTPDVIDVWVRRRGDRVSVGTCIAYGMASALWILYGISVRSMPLVVVEGYMLCLALLTFAARRRRPVACVVEPEPFKTSTSIGNSQENDQVA